MTLAAGPPRIPIRAAPQDAMFRGAPTGYAPRRAPMRSGVQPSAAPSTIEQLCVVILLTITLAVPFLSGGQRSDAGSANPIEYLNEMPSEGDPTKQAILIGVYAAAAALLAVRTRPRMLLFLGAPLLLLIVWCFASIAWSVNPGVSFRRAVALLGGVALGVYAGLRFELKDMLRLLSYTAWIVLSGSLLLAVVAPSLGLGIDGGLRGVFSHKNAQGSFAALTLLVVVTRLWETRYRSSLAVAGDIMLGVVSLVCMAIAQSTAVIPVAVAGLLLLVVARLIRTAGAGVLAFTPAGISLALLALVAAAYNSGAISEVLGKDADISGRTLVWEFVVQMIFQRPWLGYGFGAFWVGFDSPGAVFWTTQHIGVPHAHNGYLQLALDSGGIGLALFLFAVIVLAVNLARLLRQPREPHIAWAAGFLGFYLVANLSEAWLWGANDLLPVVFVYLVVRSNIGVRRALVQAAAAATDRNWSGDRRSTSEIIRQAREADRPGVRTSQAAQF